ncbi:BCNT-domain-containing protein [Glonium stellatum]|uniref:SWR1-complex protein 5 n=1 Tax=Glonium stellatum TaxID=574774 RepID=A0A8E2EW67_9PEZI|nr:BCNT-domain-containing protein [Glonium stellatum]
MAKPEPQDLSPEPEEPYHSSSDEDFNPAAVPAADDSPSSTSEDESTPATTKPSQRKRKRKAPPPAQFDSGDEATIQAMRRRRNKKRRGDTVADDDEDILLSDDEGGEGGLVKTRAQRRTEQKEQRPLARTDGATVDVDALWAQMSSAPLKPTEAISKPNAVDTRGKKDVATGGMEVPTITNPDEDLITIKRTYTFAGQRVTQEKRVPKFSAEARLYLSELAASHGTSAQPAEPTAQPESEAQADDPSPETPQNTTKKLRRPLRRPSRFDPNPTGFVRGLPPEAQLKWPRKAIIISTTLPDQENGLAASTGSPAPSAAASKSMLPPEKAQKLNVVEKSRYDWVGYVDKEGIADELDEHGRAKEAYLGRMEFLAGVEARKDEERRRMKAVAST